MGGCWNNCRLACKLTDAVLAWSGVLSGGFDWGDCTGQISNHPIKYEYGPSAPSRTHGPVAHTHGLKVRPRPEGDMAQMPELNKVKLFWVFVWQGSSSGHLDLLFLAPYALTYIAAPCAQPLRIITPVQNKGGEVEAWAWGGVRGPREHGAWVAWEAEPIHAWLLATYLAPALHPQPRCGAGSIEPLAGQYELLSGFQSRFDFLEINQVVEGKCWKSKSCGCVQAPRITSSSMKGRRGSGDNGGIHFSTQQRATELCTAGPWGCLLPKRNCHGQEAGSGCVHQMVKNVGAIISA